MLRGLWLPVLFVAMVAAGRFSARENDWPSLPARAGRTSLLLVKNIWSNGERWLPGHGAEATSVTTTSAAIVPADAPAVPIDTSRLPEPSAWPRLNPEASQHKAWLFAEGPYHPKGDNRHSITFTFDDGPFPETTPTVLRVLAKYHVHATFFVIGRYLDGEDPHAEKTRATLRQIVAEGHLVGNHTHDHRLLTTASAADWLAQIQDGERSIEHTLGARPAFFRPPYGQLDSEISRYLASQGTELTLWSIEASDMKVDDPIAMAESLESQIERDGDGIVLLHDIRPATADALARVLEWLRLRRYRAEKPDVAGYDVVDMPEYLRRIEGSPQPFENRGDVEHFRANAWTERHASQPTIELEGGRDVQIEN